MIKQVLEHFFNMTSIKHELRIHACATYTMVMAVTLYLMYFIYFLHNLNIHRLIMPFVHCLWICLYFVTRNVCFFDYNCLKQMQGCTAHDFDIESRHLIYPAAESYKFGQMACLFTYNSKRQRAKAPNSIAHGINKMQHHH